MVISLPRFEGPLDLLLDLCRKNQFDLANLPMSEVTSQYLEYIRTARACDFELNADFFYIAATLIELKSLRLLPLDPALINERTAEDAQRELIRQLLTHEQMRSGAEFLGKQLELNSTAWSAQTNELAFFTQTAEPEPESLSLPEVVRMAKRALESAQARGVFQKTLQGDAVTVDSLIAWLAGECPWAEAPVEAEVLFAGQPTMERKSILLLAMLELARQGRIWLEQGESFGPLMVLARQ